MTAFDLHETPVFELLAEAAYGAAHDPVTGLANREHVLATLDRMSERRHGGWAAVLFVSVLGAELAERILGPEAHDEVLAQAARRLAVAVGPCDVVGRIGSHEFIAVMTTTQPKLALELARRRVEQRLSIPVEIGDCLVDLDARIRPAIARCAPAKAQARRQTVSA